MTDNELLAEIKKHVLRWSYLINSQENYDALCRLADSAEANINWLKLVRKPIKKTGGSLFWVVDVIGRKAVNVHLSHTQKRTKKDIREASEKAALYASELRKLILNNDSLRCYGRELMHPVERTAIERITGGLIDTACENHPKTSHFFSDDIENELSKRHEEKYPERKGITTSHAYKILSRKLWTDDSFLESLVAFEKAAKESATFIPVVPSPNKPMASEHAFAMSLCYSLDSYYETPCHDIVAGFCSAVFENTIETDTVKKWWHRYRDTS